MRPLEGITVLDLSRVLAAPFATMLLAEMGATVIKVEQPGSGDEIRSYEPFYKGASAYFFTANRSKQSITLNLKDKRAQQIVRDLAKGADVLVENFTVGTLKRLGLDFAAIREVNPRLIYVSVTGFGQDGPYAKRRGYDTVFQAMTGMTGLTGEIGGNPVKAGLPTADLSSALWTAIAILTGIVGRSKSGEGCYVDMSMTDSQVALLTIAAARYFALGEVPTRMGTEHLGRIPSAGFQCADGGWVQITCTDAHWPGLCKVLGLEDWGGLPQFRTNAERLKNRDATMKKLRQAIMAFERDDLVAKCASAGVPAGPVYAVNEVLSDTHFLSRGMVAKFDYPGVGEFAALPVPLKFTGLDQPQVGRPPLLGEHTDAILRQCLHMNDETIAKLREEGVI